MWCWVQVLGGLIWQKYSRSTEWGHIFHHLRPMTMKWNTFSAASALAPRVVAQNCNKIRSLVKRIAFDKLVKILNETGLIFSKQLCTMSSSESTLRKGFPLYVWKGTFNFGIRFSHNPQVPKPHWLISLQWIQMSMILLWFQKMQWKNKMFSLNGSVIRTIKIASKLLWWKQICVSWNSRMANPEVPLNPSNPVIHPSFSLFLLISYYFISQAPLGCQSIHSHLPDILHATSTLERNKDSRSCTCTPPWLITGLLLLNRTYSSIILFQSCILSLQILVINLNACIFPHN